MFLLLFLLLLTWFLYFFVCAGIATYLMSPRAGFASAAGATVATVSAVVLTLEVCLVGYGWATEGCSVSHTLALFPLY
jgi:hypothetical protein